MIIYRHGNKSRIAKDIIKYFPKHDIYIEPFFGAGCMFFNKPLANYNLVNDLDNSIYNIFKCWQIDKDKLKHHIEITPICELLLKENKFQFIENVPDFDRASLDIINYINSKSNMFRTSVNNNAKKISLQRIESLFKYIQNVIFYNKTYDKFLKSLSFRKGRNDKQRCFIYCDPPYIDTIGYNKTKWTKDDLENLINILLSINIKFAISELNKPDVLELVNKYNLNLIYIKNIRNSLSNKKIMQEILITSYEINTVKQIDLFNNEI